MRARLYLLLAAMAVLVLALAVSPNVEPTVGPPVQVSGLSPYGECAVDGPGAVYPNTEVEPSVAINPANPRNVIAVWQQDRWSELGARGTVAGFSLDGGSRWDRTNLPFSACAGGLGYDRASDPWVSIGPDGIAYAVSISFNGIDHSSAIAAAVSVDGGRSWTDPSVLIADAKPETEFFNDKVAVTADPNKKGAAYVVWTRLESPTADPPADRPARAPTGAAFFARTADGGLTWGSPGVMVDTPEGQVATGNQIVVDRTTGALYDFFDLITYAPSETTYEVAFVKSMDGGTSWTGPQRIADLRPVFVTNPNTGKSIRTGDLIPEPAIDPTTGTLYVVWQDSRFSGGQYDEIALSFSEDGGATWSDPIRANAPSGRPAFTPAIAVNPAGVVGIGFYDFRDLAAETATLPTNYWFTWSTDGGRSFEQELHLAGPFDMLAAPDSGGLFLGEYQGMAISRSAFVLLFARVNSEDPANPTDVWITSVTIP